MLWLHETHQVDGRHEDDFESIYRDEWLPELATRDGARLLYFLKHAHGTGPAYRVVTITGLQDAATWERVCEAVVDGPLAAISQRLDRHRYDVVSKLLTPLPWARDAAPELGGVPVVPGDHELSLFMEDTVWPHPHLLDAYIEAAGAHYAKETADRGARSILAIQGAYRTAYGAGRRREIVLWQKVQNLAALTPLVTTEVPESFKQPGSWMNDALELRDQWESRLLRTVSWSPLY